MAQRRGAKNQPVQQRNRALERVRLALEILRGYGVSMDEINLDGELRNEDTPAITDSRLGAARGEMITALLAQARRTEDLTIDVIDEQRRVEKARRESEADFRLTKVRGAPWRLWRRVRDGQESFYELVSELDRRAASALRRGQRKLCDIVPSAPAGATVYWFAEDYMDPVDPILTRFADACARYFSGEIEQGDFQAAARQAACELASRRAAKLCALPGCLNIVEENQQFCSAVHRQRAFQR